jgi:hypothetical protein
MRIEQFAAQKSREIRLVTPDRSFKEQIFRFEKSSCQRDADAPGNCNGKQFARGRMYCKLGRFRKQGETGWLRSKDQNMDLRRNR